MACPTSVFDIFTLWYLEKLDSTCPVGPLSLSLIWWGRIGQIVQFIGALVILVEIIGPERIREFGTRLQQNNLKKYTKRYLAAIKRLIILVLMILIYGFRTIGNIFTFKFTQVKIESKRFFKLYTATLEKIWSKSYKVQLFYLLSFILFLLILGLSTEIIDRISDFLRNNTLYSELCVHNLNLYKSIACLLTSPLILSGFLLLLFYIPYLLNILLYQTCKGINRYLLQPIASCLEHQDIDKFFKIGSIVFVFFGFLMQLLATN